MSAHDAFDQRVRAGLSAAAETVEPAVDALLDQVSVRGRRRRTRGRVLRVVAAALALVGGLSAGVALARSPEQVPAKPGAPTASSVWSPQPISQMLGTYRAMIPDETMVIRSERLAGEWRLTFHADGTIEAIGPSTYSGNLAGATWRPSGNLIELDIFGEDICKDELPGTYRWTRTPDGLRFDVAADHGCPARINLLSNRMWTVVR
jgi:hypothetical protein